MLREPANEPALMRQPDRQPIALDAMHRLADWCCAHFQLPRDRVGTQRGGRGQKLETDMLIPEIRYFTNDSREVVSAFTSPNRTSGTPVLLSGKYSKGILYVLTIPQAQGELYRYPQGVLRAIREVVAKDMYVRLDAPSMVILFVYDNDKFIVESFGEEPVQARPSPTSESPSSAIWKPDRS